MTSVGKNIKLLRKQKNLSQEALAEKLHVTRQAVSNWENGKCQPDLDMLENISNALETDITMVIYGKGQRKNKPQITQTPVDHNIHLGRVFIISLALQYIMLPILKKRALATYDYTLYMLFQVAVRPLIFLLGGLTAVYFVSLFGSFSAVSKKLRYTFLFLGFGGLILYYIMSMPYMVVVNLIRAEEIPFLAGWMFSKALDICLKFPVIYSVLGVAIGLGMQKPTSS